MAKKNDACYIQAAAMREAGLTYRQIGEALGLTQQRAHQLCSNYRTVGRSVRRKYIKDSCESCGGGACRLQLHHIDLDCTNNSRSNLVTLCIPCHKRMDEVSRSLYGIRRQYMGKGRKRERTSFSCRQCGGQYLALYGRIFCSRACFAQARRMDPGEKKRLHAERCMRYYHTHKHLPSYKAAVKRNSLAYVKRHRGEPMKPERRERINVYARAYYRSHREQAHLAYLRRKAEKRV